jgi:hypothetical protein
VSLADVTARLAGELAALRAEGAALRRELERASAMLAERDTRLAQLETELAATRRVLEANVRHLEAAELERAEAQSGLGAARAAADSFRAERDAARRLARTLTGQLGMLEAAVVAGPFRRARPPTTLPQAGLIMTVALGLPKKALARVVDMVRAEAARAPLLLVVDRELKGPLDPAPAAWLRLPRANELPRRLAPDREAYLGCRLQALVEALRPVSVVPLGLAAARLLGGG